MKPFEKQNKNIIFTSLLIIVLLGFNTFMSYYSIQMIKTQQNEVQQNIIESEWQFIQSILIENEDKANIQANYIKENIKQDLLSTYRDNTSKLKYDMDNLDVNSDFLKILNKNIEGKYLNVNSDENDLFILSTWNESANIDLKGAVITDKSINCSSNGSIRTFDKELAMHSNYDLGYDALQRITNHNQDKPIFWEFLSSNNSEHKQIKDCNINELKQIFIDEGISSLKTYEILTPVYIDDNYDIFNIEKVDNLGSLNKDNRQIIVVQGYSLWDVLMKNHTTEIQEYDNQLQLENKNYNNMIKYVELINLFSNLLMFIAFISIVKVQNLAVEIEELALGDEIENTHNKNE